MIDQNKWLQYGEDGLVPKALCFHNTGNEQMSARELFDYLNNECKTSQGCHYLIDHNEIIEVMPLDWRVYHTGKGRDWAFKNCIAIEICSNLDNDLYKQGQDKAITLAKQLMETYNLSTDDIYFHNDFADFYCPKDILSKYGNKQNFIREEFLTNGVHSS